MECQARRRSVRAARRVLIEDIRSRQEELAAPWRGSAGGVASRDSALPAQWSLRVPLSTPHLTATVATTDLSTEYQPRKPSAARLDPAKVKSLADQRAELLEQDRVIAGICRHPRTSRRRARDKALEDVSDATRKQAVLLVTRQQCANQPTPISATRRERVQGLRSPITSGYSIAARFGQVGPWARYHTGLDFSSPVGTPLHAPAAGVVTNAGIGPASGWAGNYVAIKYPDGTHTP